MLRGLDRLKIILEDLPKGAKLVFPQEVAERFEIHSYTSASHKRITGVTCSRSRNPNGVEWVFERLWDET